MLAALQLPSHVKSRSVTVGYLTIPVLVLEPTASVRLTTVAADASDGRDVVLVVGPEGGIAPEELTALADAGARLVRLGDTVLRTSTAGLAASAALLAQTTRWA